MRKTVERHQIQRTMTTSYVPSMQFECLLSFSSLQQTFATWAKHRGYLRHQLNLSSL